MSGASIVTEAGCKKLKKGGPNEDDCSHPSRHNLKGSFKFLLSLPRVCGFGDDNAKHLKARLKDPDNVSQKTLPSDLESTPHGLTAVPRDAARAGAIGD